MKTAYSITFAATLLLAGCGDSSEPKEHQGGPLPGAPTAGLALSAPVPRAAAGGNPNETVVFVSVAPGTIARAATVEIESDGVVERTLAATDGGFDPVAVPGEAGDEVKVTVTDSAGGKTTKSGIAKERMRPRVVRTSPAARKTDVPLNIRVSVVFTTPMDSASVVSGVTVLVGGAAVSGTWELKPGALAVEFTPTSPLVANSNYELRVAGSVRDVLGTTLGDGLVVGFRTASESAPGGQLDIYTSKLPWNGVLAVGESIQVQAILPVRWSSSDPTVLQDLFAGSRPSVSTIFQGTRVGRTTVRAAIGDSVGEMVVDVVAAASLRLSISVTGDDPDGDFSLDDNGNCWSGGGAFPDSCARYPVHAGVNVLTLGPGSRTFRLWDVAANCSVSGGDVRNVAVESGATIDLSFDVACTALTPVTLRVSALASGSPQPNDYLATTGNHGECNLGHCVLRWVPGGWAEVRAFPGTQEVRLYAPVFCRVVSPNPVVATIIAGSVADVTFQVACTPPGHVRVTVTAHGSNIPSELSIQSAPCAQGEVWENCFAGQVPTGPGRSFLSPALRADRPIDVQLYRTANCQVTSANPVRVTPQSGGTVDVSFDVTCE